MISEVAGFNLRRIAIAETRRVIQNSDQNPLFRKVILPWYDTDAACVLTGLFMMAVFGFSLVGVSVALETPGWGGYVWVPDLLILLSAVGIATISLRLFRRYAYRSKQDLP
jgi:hypothetical protein